MAVQPYIGVVGPSEASAEQLATARAVGESIATAGAVLVCGGLGGVMEAACRGASERGGTTVGLLPGGDRAAANPFVTVAIATGMGEMRNALVVRTVDAVIGIGGGWGTLSELALARRTAVPLFVLGSWEVLPSDGTPAPVGEVARDPAEAVARALAATRRPASG